MWHALLGHPHHKALKEALNYYSIHVPPKPIDGLCSTYCLGKSHRISTPSSTTTYHTPLELIVCDL